MKTRLKLNILVVSLLKSVTVGLFAQENITLAPSADTTIISENNNSGGAATGLYIGRTAAGDFRRALIAFDLTGQVPIGATIESVDLLIGIDGLRSNGSGSPATLHKVTSEWGEGATSGGQGKGSPALAGDATWANRFHPSQAWNNQGGDFSSVASNQQTIAARGGVMIWTSAQMVADVQSWLDNPSTNFGWIIRGDESRNRTGTKLSSREGAVPPQLLITFRAAVILSDQTITFDPIESKGLADAPFDLLASSDSGLAVSFSVVSGPATLAGQTLTLTGVGTVTIEASQAGNDGFNPAPSVQRSFDVNQGLLAWQQAHFLADELSDPAIAGLNADPDGDRLSNLQEYAFGKNPRVPDYKKGPIGEMAIGGGGKIRLNFQRNSSASDITIRLQRNDSLEKGGWVTVAESVNGAPMVSTSTVTIQEVSDSESNLIEITARDNLLSDETMRFNRLLVVQ